MIQLCSKEILARISSELSTIVEQVMMMSGDARTMRSLSFFSSQLNPSDRIDTFYEDPVMESLQMIIGMIMVICVHVTTIICDL